MKRAQQRTCVSLFACLLALAACDEGGSAGDMLSDETGSTSDAGSQQGDSTGESTDPPGTETGGSTGEDMDDPCLASVNDFLACGANINATKEQLEYAGKREPQSEPTDDEELETDDGVAMVCSSTNYSLLEAPQTYIALDPHADTLFPGSLVQGDPVHDGRLEGIPVGRKPGEVTLTLLSGAGAEYSRPVEPPMPMSSRR